MRPRALLAVCLVFVCADIVAQVQSEDTIKQLTAAVETGTATREQHLQLAREYLGNGQYYEASRIARRLLDKDSTDADARLIRDEASAQRAKAHAGQVAEAEELAGRPDATDEDRLALANAYFDAGRYKDAAAAYGKLRGPLDRETRLRHARSLSWSSRTHDADAIYAALLAEEHSPEIELEYGRMLSWMGASDASLKHLQAVHKASPSEDTALALANAHAWSGNRQAAIDLLRDFTKTERNAHAAAALLQELETSPQLRIERVDRMIVAEPNNLALRLHRARLLMEADRYSDVLRETTFIREHWSEPVDGLDEIERQARERRAEVVKVTRARLAGVDLKDVTRAEEMLSLARAFTSAGEYDEAIELYEHYLRLNPDDSKVRHDFARVLSWDRRWNAAERQYQHLLREHPDRADLRLEYAQVLSYDSDYAAAIPMFSSLTDLSDNRGAHLYTEVPPKAHYNLGQIYRWYGWNEHAAEHQSDALSFDGGYLPARNELELARHGRPGTTFSTRYTTSTNSNDFTLTRVDLEGELWRNQKTALQLGVGRHNFDHRSATVDATSVNGGLTYRTNDRFTVRGRLGATLYDDSLGTRPFWGLGAAWTPNLQSRAALDYNRYDLIYDVFTLTALALPEGAPQISPTDAAISIDEVRAHYDYNSGGLISFLGEAAYGLISDDNRRTSAHGIVSFRIWKEPFIALKADGRVLSYDQRTNRYWSPDDYSSLAGVLQIGQNVRDRFFWSAELKYGKSWDGDRESDLRAYGARITVPINDVLDAVGSWSYGRSGDLDSITGLAGSDRVSYWQRSWYVGVRLKRLFISDEDRASNRYYFDNRRLTDTAAATPVTENQ